MAACPLSPLCTESDHDRAAAQYIAKGKLKWRTDPSVTLSQFVHLPAITLALQFEPIANSDNQRQRSRWQMLRAEAPPAVCRVLIVEDEWLLASDLEAALKSLGADVTALVGDIDDARAQIVGGGFDVGVIDINLRGRNTFGLVDELQRQGIPFVFTTGYSAEVIPARFANVTRFEKPFDPQVLAQYVVQLGNGGSQRRPPP